MIEEILITARDNAKVDPYLSIWTWEISVYLFLGGMTAGMMIFAAWAVLAKKDDLAPFASSKLALWAPIVLSIGMTTLFLDLEHKLYVWRFYTTLQVASPMSWGSWILILVYPVAILQVLSTLRAGYPKLAQLAERLPLVTPVLDISESQKRRIALASIPLGIGLAIYTGILLSSFSARPFWNTGILGPLFLVSGLSTAAAFVLLATKAHAEKLLFARIDIVLILVEMLLIGLFIVNLTTGSEAHLNAARLILGGEFTLLFWGWFFTLGLVIPLLIEILEIRGSRLALVTLGPVLVLMGGYLLRQVMMDVGQVSTWTQYESQYDMQLLQRLER